VVADEGKATQVNLIKIGMRKLHKSATRNIKAVAIEAQSGELHRSRTIRNSTP